jgi:ATP-dependent Clp protease ATP-binding subunit ClpA
VKDRHADIVSVNDLLETLSRQTGRPIAALTGDDRTALRNLAGELKKRIIGQDVAVETVAAMLVQRRQDLGPTERPLGVFLFAGDTGVGKTELARSIAALFYGSENKLLHLDMAEYAGPGDVNKLIGSPLGHVDSDKEGKLVGWLHAQGCGVILFDEVEKGHDLHHLLLGLLDNGRIASARGETLDARQCVIVATTNAITSDDMRRGSMTFGQADAKPNPTDLLAKRFPREFLGRFDSIVLFNRLQSEDMRRIMKLRLDEARERMASKAITLIYDEDKLLDHLLTALDQTRSGARGIARLIDRAILQPIALSATEFESGTPLTVALDDEFCRTGRARASRSGIGTNRANDCTDGRSCGTSEVTGR